MYSTAMNLHDLPIEILTKVLPIQTNLTRFSQGTIIKWLNLLPQRQSFEVLVQAGVGIVISKNYGTFHIEKEPGVSQLWAVGAMNITLAEKSELNKLFQDVVYLHFGSSAAKEYFGKYLIFQFQIVEDLLVKNCDLFRLMRIWSGDECIINYTRMCFFGCNSSGRHAKILYPLMLDAEHEYIEKFCYSMLKINSDTWSRTLRFCYSLLARIRSIEVIVTIKQYRRFVERMLECGSKFHLCPISLCVKITSNTTDSNNTLTNHSIDNTLPNDFPIKWITNVFWFT
ncbi:hypothetical protein KGF57_003832 [Candida theae]|uniref:Uncharacterized protein n=1 Tax=Candida theae TaxID=1198502 RepID=A0AAD5FXE4_9ASCO|nr:uncharacterized protein KGF57_003832 [Candida theae]KAI5954808.1 hypothetical protein KGF57_003832 [Candida theae]